jgi:N utilization substance protein A
VRAEINSKTGELRLSRHLLVVENVSLQPDQSGGARRHNPAAQIGDTISDALRRSNTAASPHSPQNR